jgi:acetyl esterase/lipase
MSSWQAKAFRKGIELSKRRSIFESEQAMDRFMEEVEKRPVYKLAPKYMQKHNISLFHCNEMDVYVLNQHSVTGKTIIYFHGGAYINQPLIFHWRYLVKLARLTGHKIYIPIYPKLPQSNHVDCFRQLDYFYETIIEKLQTSIIFMGDSAGGGLAMAFAQKLAGTFKRTPDELILLSAWLDVAGNYENYEQLEQLDPMIAIPGAKQLGRKWAEPSHVKNPLVSPIYGPLDGIGHITSIVGTHELLLFDARRLKERCDEEGIPIHYFEFEEMNHVFPVYPIPEAKKALQIVLDILLQEHAIASLTKA